MSDVLITSDEYNNLVRKAFFIDCLWKCGVATWDIYPLACKLYHTKFLEDIEEEIL